MSPRLSASSWVQLRSRVIHESDESRFEESAHLRAGSHVNPLISAYHQGHPFEMIIGTLGEATRCLWAAGRDGPDPRSLFPESASVSLIDTAALSKSLEGLRWVEATLGTHDAGEPAADFAADLEDLLLYWSNGPCVWIVQAQPVSLSGSNEVIELERLIGLGERGGPREQHAGEQAQRVLAHLRLSEPLGLWKVGLSCGSATSADAGAILGRLLATSLVRGSRSSVTTQSGVVGLVSSEVVAAFTRAPIVEVPGIRVRRAVRWDVTPERRGPISIGQVISGRTKGLELSAKASTINRHVFVSGATGSGKSETVRRLLGELTDMGIPWLVIEPAKAEYHELAELLHPRPVQLIRLGGTQDLPVGLNPLEPSSITTASERLTFNLATHIALVRELFGASFDIEDPFPQILALALDRSYEACGWDLISGRRRGLVSADRKYPNLGDLRRNALDVVDELGYGREISDNVRGAVDVRINGLRNGAAGRFFENGHPIDLEAMSRSNVILQIEDLGNERDQAFLIGCVLIRWTEMLRLRGDTGGKLRHVLVIEEAHRLLRATDDSRSSAIEQFANILAEVRSYGQGLIIAEQIPSKLIPDVIKNSALKIMHRLPSLDDRDAVGGTMNLNATQSEAVVSFAPGTAAVHTDGMDYPILVQVPKRPLTGGPQPTTEVAVGPRSRSCSKGCKKGAPCSSAQLGVATRLVADDAFACLVDLTVLSYLIGETRPTLDSNHCQRWKRIAGTPRQLRCALGLAVDMSVTARIKHILDFYNPGLLGLVVASDLFEQMTTGVSAQFDPTWQVAEYRWRDVVQAIRRSASGDKPPISPVDIDLWRTRGLVLKSIDVDEQLEELTEHHQLLATDHVSKLYGEPSILIEVLRRRNTRSMPDMCHWLGTPEPWIPGRLKALPKE